jgi:hypothetical protein
VHDDRHCRLHRKQQHDYMPAFWTLGSPVLF